MSRDKDLSVETKVKWLLDGLIGYRSLCIYGDSEILHHLEDGLIKGVVIDFETFRKIEEALLDNGLGEAMEAV